MRDKPPGSDCTLCSYRRPEAGTTIGPRVWRRQNAPLFRNPSDLRYRDFPFLPPDSLAPGRGECAWSAENRVKKARWNPAPPTTTDGARLRPGLDLMGER